MTKEQLDTYEEIARLQSEIKAREERVKELKSKVIKWHDGKPLLCEDGWESRLKTTARNTFQTEIAGRALNVDLSYDKHPEWYKHTVSQSVVISRRIDENAPVAVADPIV